jgi:hypothetical protein
MPFVGTKPESWFSDSLLSRATNLAVRGSLHLSTVTDIETEGNTDLDLIWTRPSLDGSGFPNCLGKRGWFLPGDTPDQLLEWVRILSTHIDQVP